MNFVIASRIGFVGISVFIITRLGFFGSNDIYLKDNSFIIHKNIKHCNRIFYTKIKWDLEVNKYYLSNGENLFYSSIKPVNVYLNENKIN